MRLKDATKKYLLSNIMTENLDFQQQLKLFNKSGIWDSNTLYLFTLVHEYKVKYDFLIPQKPKIFERLNKTTEFDMLKSFAALYFSISEEVAYFSFLCLKEAR